MADLDRLEATADGVSYITLSSIPYGSRFYGWFYEPPKIAELFDPEQVDKATGECKLIQAKTVFFMSVNPKNPLEKKLLASATVHLLSLVEKGISQNLYRFYKDCGENATRIKLVYERKKMTHTGNSMAEWTIYRLSN